MKKNKKSLFLILSLIVLALIFVVSCANEEETTETPDYTIIETPNLIYQNGAYEVNISSNIQKIYLPSYFIVSEEATYEISTTEDFSNIVDDEVEIEAGENVFYLRVKHGDKEKVYKFLFLKKKLCTVTFEINGKTEEISPIQCDQGSEISEPKYTVQGYTIQWNYDFTQPIQDDITITATLFPKLYKVTVSAPGADIDGKIFNVKYDKPVELETPIKKGNLFIGWQYNGNAFDPTKNFNFTNDIEIVAQFEEIPYSINYFVNGGINNSQNPIKYTVTSNEIVLLPATWEDDSYDFDGWYTDSSLQNKITKIEAGSVGDIVLYAKWSKVAIPEPPAPTKTTITFDAPGYNCDKTSIEVTFGEEYSLPVLEKDGYIFNGWTMDSSSIPTTGVWAMEDTEITLTPATWSLKTYTITYIIDGGVNDPNNPNTFTVEDEINLLNPTKEYTKSFLGWYTDAELTQKIEIISGQTANIVVYAAWEYSNFTITFNTDGGNLDSLEKNVIYGNNYELPIPVKNGYDFDGWYDSNGDLIAQNGQWLIESDATLIAKWKEISYTIEYDLDGGNQLGIGWVTTYTVNSENFTLPVPEKAGKIFLGWTTESTTIPKAMLTIEKGTTGNLKIYANWCDEKDESGFLYRINSDGTAAVVGYVGVIGNMTIPSEFDGHTVTVIANDAFNGFEDKLTGQSGNNFYTLQIPKTIIRIGANAFANCADLKIQLITDSDDDVKPEKEIEDWSNTVLVESGNDHVIDVIKSIRPAIGWNPYIKP